MKHVRPHPSSALPSALRRPALRSLASQALIAAWIVAGLPGCGHALPPPPAGPASAPAATDSRQAWEQLRAEIGEARCSEPAQCRTVAVGHKACGGPSGYLVWSSAHNGDGARVQALAERHRELSRQEVLRSGQLSNCAMVTDPGAQCQAGRCVLQTAPRTGSPGLQ